MKRVLIPFARAAVLACALLGSLVMASVASAGTIDLDGAMFTPGGTKSASGDGSSVNLSHAVKTSGSISDVIYFSLSGPMTTLDLSVNTFGHFYNLTVSFLDTAGNSLSSIVAPFKFATGVNGTTGDIGFQWTFTSAIVSQLLASNFGAIKVTGYFCSCAGYSLALSDPTVTPIPPAVVMFLTALVGMGGIGWYRNKALAAV